MSHFVQFFPFSALLVLPVLFPGPGRGAFVLPVEQEGSAVRVSGEGSVNTLGLIPAGTANDWTSSLSHGKFYAGPLAFSDGRVDLYSGLSTPSSVGTDPGVYELPDQASSSGDLFGIPSDNGLGLIQLVLPRGYRPGDSLAGIATFAKLSLSTLGLAPGQVSTWTWCRGAERGHLPSLQETAPSAA